MLGKLDGSNIYRYERPRLVSGQETIQGRRTTTNYSFLGALEIERSALGGAVNFSGIGQEPEKGN
jgi:hypothetical protein